MSFFHRPKALWAGCGLTLALGGSLSADTPPASTSGETERRLELAPLQIEVARMYKPEEAGWRMAEVPGFRVYSHQGAATKTVMDELQIVREALGLVWSEPRLLRQWVTVVVCADEPEFMRWGNVAPGAFDRLTRAVWTPAGLVLVVNGGDETVHRAVGRVYVRALLAGSTLPTWLQEGLASIMNSAELSGDRLVVGQLKLDPRDELSMSRLRQLAIATTFARTPTGGQMPDGTLIGNVNAPGSGPILQNSRGEAVEVLVDGGPTTYGQLSRALEDEQRRRLERQTKAQGDASFAGYLRDTSVMALEKLFDPKEEETVDWRMNAWAFTHLGLFGDKSRHRAHFLAFVQKLQQSPGRVPAELFQEAFDETPRRFRSRLRTYAEGSRYDALSFKLAEPYVPPVPVLVPAPETGVLLLKARVYAANGRDDEVREFLQRGYVEPSNRTPGYVTTLARAWRDTDRSRALEVLDAAEKKGGLDLPGRRLQAELRLATLTAARPQLLPGEMPQVLDPLFAALNAGDTSEELFLLIGRAWLASEVPPQDGHLNALRLGLTYYPESPRLGEMMTQLQHRL